MSSDLFMYYLHQYSNTQEKKKKEKPVISKFLLRLLFLLLKCDMKEGSVPIAYTVNIAGIHFLAKPFHELLFKFCNNFRLHFRT